MLSRDYFTGALWALLILALNFAIAFVAVFVYALFIRPGQSPEFYEQAAPGIASWTAPIGGGLLFFLVGFFRANRNPNQSAYSLVFMMWVFYVIFDIALGFFLSPSTALISWQLLFSLSIALVGGLAGARLASSHP